MSELDKELVSVRLLSLLVHVGTAKVTHDFFPLESEHIALVCLCLLDGFKPSFLVLHLQCFSLIECLSGHMLLLFVEYVGIMKGLLAHISFEILLVLLKLL